MASGPAVARVPVPVDALNQLNEIATHYCESQMFFAGCSLGIFEALTMGPATAAELAQRLGFHEEAGHRLMAGLWQAGLLTREGERFANSGVGIYLTSSAPVPLTPLLAWGKLFYPMWGNLDSAVREYSPRWQQTFGVTQQQTFENLYKNPDELRRFCSLMSAYSIPQGQLLAEAFDFSQCSCVLDVAGGPGGLIIELGKKYQHIRGIVMDLPPVCALADEAIAAAGLSGRFVSRHADLFDGPYPDGADAISLAWVLHDWNDEHCRQILRNCHTALPAGGTLLITESVLNPDRAGTAFATLMSLHMLLLCEPGARERTEAEYAELLGATGFRVEGLVRMAAPRDLLVARKE
jgi:hypothetical protein